MTEHTTPRYLCTFTHHRGGGASAAMFANDARPRAEAHAKAESVEHPSAKVEVVAICETGQRVLATWTKGCRNGAPRWIAYAAAILIALASDPAQAQNGRWIPDPGIQRTIAAVAALYPAPDGCAVVGGWEDGSIVAYCVDADTYIAHGPDAQDAWDAYGGPLMGVWEERATHATK